MKKIFFMAAVAALALSSCSSTEEVLNAPEQVAENAIAFDVYGARVVNRAEPNTVASKILDQTNWESVDLHRDGNGFGVYAYETGNVDFDTYVANKSFPNFMFDQHVNDAVHTNDAGTFSYAPLKYWPNDGGKVTFQAFAPYYKYVDNTITTKKVSQNALFGAEYGGVGIRYNATENYDLLWATNENKTKASHTTNSTETFTFAHALSKVDVVITYDYDAVCDAAGALGGEDKTTKILVRSVKLVGHVPTQGILHLADGTWTYEQSDENVYVKGHADFTSYKTSEAPADANEVTPDADADKGALGWVKVSSADTDIKALKSTVSWMAIPTDGDVAVEIVYDVITTDNTEKHNTSIVTNVINSADVAQGASNHAATFSINKNTKTTLNIHLGMTSAKFSASVSEWNPTGVTEKVDLTPNVAGS